MGRRERNVERVPGGERDLPDGRDGGWHGTENLQQRAHPGQTGGAGKAVAAGADGGVAESDQSSLFI